MSLYEVKRKAFITNDTDISSHVTIYDVIEWFTTMDAATQAILKAADRLSRTKAVKEAVATKLKED